MIFAIGTIALCLVLLILWVVTTQRQLVNKDELCGNALSQIGVQQSSRWDALMALVQLTKQYSEHEYKTLMKTVIARQDISKQSGAKEVDAQENMITATLGRIMAVAE